jgi:hypothetical protein
MSRQLPPCDHDECGITACRKVDKFDEGVAKAIISEAWRNLSSTLVGMPIQDPRWKPATEWLNKNREFQPSPFVSKSTQSPLPLPDSEGWWWCRSNDGDCLPNDELCVEVTQVNGENVIVHFGHNHGYIKDEDRFSQGWFGGCDWIKAKSPWEDEN